MSVGGPEDQNVDILKAQESIKRMMTNYTQSFGYDAAADFEDEDNEVIDQKKIIAMKKYQDQSKK